MNIDFLLQSLQERLNPIIKDVGEPVRPLPQHIDALKNSIIQNPANNNPAIQKNFFVIAQVKQGITFSYNVDKYLDIPNGEVDYVNMMLTLNDNTIGTSYLADYFEWALATYSFVSKHKETIDFNNVSYKIRLPMRCKDGKHYWVLQESKPLEFDRNNNLVSHLNTYTITNRYTETQPTGLIAEMYLNGFYHDQWNKIIAETKFAVKPFTPHKTQSQILEFFHTNPNASLQMCSEHLKQYTVNTLKKYISNTKYKNGIIDMARAAFPQIPINNLKDVIAILGKIGWFN